ncbi:MAG: tRNA lysidine(34) synthetase TilS [Planctomycetota bacterium]
MTGSAASPTPSFEGPFPDRQGSADPWRDRWTRLSRGLGLGPNTPVAIALSGGADSVYVLQLIARADPRPRALAIHVDHGLRGEESRADAEFCARTCARLGVPFARRVVDLDPDASDLEARAREARYRALAEEATAAGIDVLLTGHHEDDAVETLLMRWMRGTDMAGLAGLRRETVLGASHGKTEAGRPLCVLRPLVGMRREEVRSALRREGIAWREDSSNAAERFTRNRVRHEVLPQIEAECGSEGVDQFFEFARAVESFEEELADRTAHITWQPVAHEAARRPASMPDVGGRVPREQLSDLSAPLLRRALGRLVGEGTGRRPTRDQLQRLSDDVVAGRTGRMEVHEGWTLQLQSDALHLTPPTSGGVGAAVAAPVAPPVAPKVRPETKAAPSPSPSPGPSPGHAKAEAAPPAETPAQAPLPTRDPQAPMTGTGLTLGLPGSVQLDDGRSIHAEPIAGTATGTSAPPISVEIDADGLTDLRVRFVRPGDRFRALGAPGHKPVRRFLGEKGIPREERGNVPLVLQGDEIVWIAGVEIADSVRVRPTTTRRVRLSLGGVRGS